MASSQNNEKNAFESESSRTGEPRSPDAELAEMLAGDLQRYLTQQVGALGGLAGAWSEKFEQSSGDAVSKGKQEVVHAYGEAKRYIRENPVKSVAGSFAVGAIIGIFTSR